VVTLCGSSALLRLASKTANGSFLFPECVSGQNDVAGCESAAWNVPLHHRGHALEHIVAKHEAVKESCGRMAHG